MVALAGHDVACLAHTLVFNVRTAQHFCGHADRRQRIAEFMREHGKKLVLANVGLSQLLDGLARLFLGSFHAVDVDIDPAQFPRIGVQITVPIGVQEEPSVLALCVSQPHLRAQRLVAFVPETSNHLISVSLMEKAQPFVQEQVCVATWMPEQPLKVLANVHRAAFWIPGLTPRVRGPQHSAHLLSLSDAALEQLVTRQVQRDLREPEQSA